MSKGALVAAIFSCFVIGAADAQAKMFELRTDPSGAPMCFTLDGEKAPLASCQAGVTLRLDPSGAPMCFTASGDKAPLADCQAASAITVRRFDPSGAPMCFTAAGEKAPLASCQGAARAAALIDSDWVAGFVALMP